MGASASAPIRQSHSRFEKTLCSIEYPELAIGITSRIPPVALTGARKISETGVKALPDGHESGASRKG
jgi:hypothetical protein